MYGIGDLTVYGTLGVMEIIDIKEELVGDIKKNYYVLKEYKAHSSSLTYVPVDNELLLSQMRPLLSREEVLSVIERSKDVPLIPWIEDNRKRLNEYKRIMQDGDHLAILAMIATIKATGERRISEGKKNYLSDEGIMHKAEKLIYSEFAIILDISEDEVKKLF